MYRFPSLAPDGSKWLQKNPNSLKWLEMASNNFKWLELLEMATKGLNLQQQQNAKKWPKNAPPKKNNQFKGFQVWLQMTCHHLKLQNFDKQFVTHLTRHLTVPIHIPSTWQNPVKSQTLTKPKNTLKQTLA